MMTDDQVTTAVMTWLNGLFAPVLVIRAHQDGPEPTYPYLTVHMSHRMKVREYEQETQYVEGTPDSDDLFPPITATPVFEVDWRYSINVYGPGASEYLNKLESAARLTQILEPAFPDLVLNDISAIRLLPEIINEKWCDRAQCDIFVRGLAGDGFVIDVIDVIDFDISTEGP